MKNFKDLIKEIKTNENKGLVEKQKGLSFDFSQPFDKKKLEEANLLNKINEIIKFRDPILETMEYKEWVGILQNKLVEELDPKHAKMLYEQDMFRAEKVQASRVGRSSAGGGVRRRKVTVTVTPFSPAELLDNDGQWYDSTDTTKAPEVGGYVNQWDPTVDWAGSPGTGFVLTTNTATVQNFTGGGRGLTGAFQSTSTPNQFPNIVNNVGLPWSVGYVLEIDAAAAADSSSAGFYIPGWVLYWSGAGDNVYLDAVGHNQAVTPSTLGVGRYSIIGTHDAVQQASGGGGWTTKIYVNGVLAVTHYYGGVGAHGAYATASFPYFQVGNATVLLGDMFFVEGVLDQAAVDDLHGYWEGKFNLP